MARPIDADAVMENIGKIPQLRGITYSRMKRAVEETPTIDAEPVRHGRWKWKNGKEFCSVCKKQNEPKRHFEDGTVEEYDYCPNCGAKMDGGAEDEKL